MIVAARHRHLIRRTALCVLACAILLFVAGRDVHAAGGGSGGITPDVGVCQVTHWVNKQNVNIEYTNGVSHYTGTLSIYGLYDNNFGGGFCGYAKVIASLKATVGSRDTTIQAEMDADTGTFKGANVSVSGVTGATATSDTGSHGVTNATGIDRIGLTVDKSTYTWGGTSHPW